MLAMGYLTTGEIFENMLQLKRFGLYFEGIRILLYTLIQKKNHIHTTITLHTHYRHSKYNIDYI